MSLKDLLHQKIKESGYLSYGACCQLTVEQEYKVGTMERRLRDLTTKSKGHVPDVEPVFSIGKRRGGKYISGYKAVNQYLAEIYKRTVSINSSPYLPYFKVSNQLTESKTNFNDPA